MALPDGVVIGADGIARPEADEAQINGDCLRCFSSPEGRRVLAYLKRITVLHVLGPTASDAELRDMEGRRFIVGLMDRRTNLAATTDAGRAARAGGDGERRGAAGSEQRGVRAPRGRRLG